MTRRIGIEMKWNFLEEAIRGRTRGSWRGHQTALGSIH